jgi:hypothetical protein
MTLRSKAINSSEPELVGASVVGFRLAKLGDLRPYLALWLRGAGKFVF